MFFLGGVPRRLDLAGKNSISLSANHLQKLRLSFQLTSPLGNVFKPHQVESSSCPFSVLSSVIEHWWTYCSPLQAFLKLRHESKVEHIFVVENSGKNFEIILVKFS